MGFFLGGELLLFGVGGVENASAVSLFKKIFALFFWGGKWPSLGGDLRPPKTASRKAWSLIFQRSPLPS